MSAAPGVSYSDTTFRAYSSQQARDYASARGGYSKSLVEYIVARHERTGGRFDRLLDVGCGPGNSTRDFAVHFDSAIGIDPSPEMVATAASLAGEAKASPIEFRSADAELCECVPADSIDLLTAATSAHWFDMEHFWPSAARVLRPGGSVAIFTVNRMYPVPATPHAEEICRLLDSLMSVPLGPFQKQGNWSVLALYKDMQMPWLLPQPCHAFPESQFQRRVWNEDNMPENGEFFCGERVRTLDEVQRTIESISTVTRWREAHPDLAHTPEDCVVETFAEIRRILGSTVATISIVGPTVLLFLKKA